MAEYWEVGLIEIIDLVVTGISGVAAVAAVIVSLRQVGQEKLARAEKLRRSQAESVSCWFEDGPEGPRSLDDKHVWQYVVLRNESESPVYDAIVACVGLRGGGPRCKGRGMCGGLSIPASTGRASTGRVGSVASDFWFGNERRSWCRDCL